MLRDLVYGMQADKRAVVANVVRRMLHSKLAGAFEAWISWTIERQDLRQRAEQLIKRWQAWNLSAAFKAFQANRLHCQSKRLVSQEYFFHQCCSPSLDSI